MKNFFDTDIPAWYEVSWYKDNIIVQVHKTAFMFMINQPWDKGPVILDWKKLYGSNSFTPPQEGDCGFLDSFKHTESNNRDWVAWKIEIPNIKTAKPQSIMALRKTMDLFFRNVLGLFDADTKCSYPQLVLIDGVGLGHGNNSATMGVSFSSTISRFLKSRVQAQDHDIVIPEIADTMRYVHNELLCAAGRNNRFSFEVTQSGYVVLHVPGNATYLSTGENHSWIRMKLDTHNCDSFAQQITLLAGISKLHNLIRAG